jgi:hypothetical protein
MQKSSNCEAAASCVRAIVLRDPASAPGGAPQAESGQGSGCRPAMPEWRPDTRRDRPGEARATAFAGHRRGLARDLGRTGRINPLF